MPNTLAHLDDNQLSAVVRAADLATAVLAALKSGRITDAVAHRAITESLVFAFRRKDRTAGARTWAEVIEHEDDDVNLDEFSILEDGPLVFQVALTQPSAKGA